MKNKRCQDEIDIKMILTNQKKKNSLEVYYYT